MTQSQRIALKMIDKALRAAGRKLSLRSIKERNAMLAFAAMDMAEAYEIGAEEAQSEILRRLHEIRRALRIADVPVSPRSYLDKELDAAGDYAQQRIDRLRENPRG